MTTAERIWRTPSVSRYVVGAVVVRGQKALILQRAADDFLGGMWELPSGTVGADETFEDALKRELTEETGLGLVSVTVALGSFEYVAKSGKLTRQVNFAVEAKGNAVRLSEHENFTWVAKENLDAFNLSDETRYFLHMGLSGDEVPSSDQMRSFI